MSSISPKAKRLKWGCDRDKLDHNSHVLSLTSPMIVWNFGCFFWFKIWPVALSSLKAAFEARVDDAWSALLLTKVWATCVGCKARKAERLQAMKYLGSLELPLYVPRCFQSWSADESFANPEWFYVRLWYAYQLHFQSPLSKTWTPGWRALCWIAKNTTGRFFPLTN